VGSPVDLEHNLSRQPFTVFSQSDFNPERSFYACYRFGFLANTDDSLSSQKEPQSSVPKDSNRVLEVDLGLGRQCASSALTLVWGFEGGDSFLTACVRVYRPSSLYDACHFKRVVFLTVL